MLNKLLKQINLILYSFKLIVSICKTKFIIIICLSVINGIFPTITLMLTQKIINTIQLMNKSFQEVIILLVIYVIFMLINMLIKNITSYYMNQLNIILNYKVNYKIMDKSSKLSLQTLELSDTYDMITRITNEASIKPYQALTSIIGIFTALITFISASSLIFVWNKWIYILLLISSIIMFYYNIKIANREFDIRYKRSDKERKSWYYTYLLTHDTAFKEVKILNLKKYLLDKYWNLGELFIKQECFINKIRILLNIFLSVLQDGIAFLIMFLSIWQAYMGKILIGSAIMYINSITIVQSNIESLASDIYSIHNSNLYMALLKDFLKMEENIQNKGQIVENIESIHVNELYFDYPNKKNALKGINLEINKGETVSIVGKNGSGKTTLLKILCALYNPTNGVVKINGIDLKDINIDSYHKQISVLFQDYLKFEGSLLENVQIGDIDKKINTKEIERSLKSAGVDFFIKDEQYCYDKTLGTWFDNGSQISGGQWQKIALSRAYYKDAHVYFLDEPSSALDVEAELKVFDSFFEQSKNKIGIYITHRFKIAKKADKIIVIKGGKIAGVGNHEYLMKNCNLYKKLYLEEEKII